MKKISALIILLCCCLFLNGFIPVAPAATAPVAEIDKVIEARIQNMLNVNTVYGEDFLDNQKLVNAAMIMLKSYADDEGFVKSELVATYIKDMYDVDVDINERINEGLPQKAGYVLLIPRGHSVYSHTVTDITDMGDYLLVKSNVVIKTHDGEAHEAQCVTKLIENEQSVFGYSILDSQIEEITGFFRV